MQQTAPTPPSAPVLAPQATPTATSNAAEMYQAMRAQRRELGRQLESLEEKRGELQQQLQQAAEGPSNSVDRKGIEQRLTDIDQRIAETDKQIAAADAAVAKTAAVPGAVIETPPRQPEGPPDEVLALSGIFILAVLMPLSIAWARRIWRRGAAAVTALPKDLMDRLGRIEQAVDAIAVETERLGEGQRFVTSILADPGSARALGAGAAEPVEVAQRERVAQRRGE
jgi:hypothetical protein